MRLTIFNINMFLLPLKLSKDNKTRLKNLIQFIRETQPDIITLQETFLKKHIKNLKKDFKNYYFTNNPNKLLNRGGLLVMSKQKPVDSEFFLFSNIEKKLDNKLLGRGIIQVVFEKFNLYDAHLSTMPGSTKIERTVNEFDILKSKINPDKTAIVCGDMNLDEQQFIDANKGFFELAEDEKNTFSFDNPYVRKWWDPKVRADKKIDYVLIKTKSKFSYKSETVKEPLMSDHYGILTELSF